MEESKAKPAVGRPSSYDPKYCREIVSYFDRPPVIDGEAVDLPTLSGFARKIKKHRETLLNWAEHSPEFFDAIKLCKDMQEDILVQNALKGRYEQAFSIIFAKNNLGWKDRQDFTSNGEKILTRIELVYYGSKDKTSV